MHEILNIINQIKNTSSRNEKEFILKQNENNKLFKDILQFIYNPYILTGISKKKISKKLKLPTEKSTFSIIEVMDYLKSHNSGRDNDIVLVQHFIKSQPEDLQDLYTKIITKDLSIGITADTINKVYGDFIPTFDVMLAKKFDEHKEKVTGNFVLTKKLDGNRLVTIKENGIVKSFTRQGNQYEGLEEIESEIQMLPIDNIVFDGELIAECDGSTLEAYAETTSKARKKGKNKTGLLFHIFDMIPLDEFQSGKSKKNCVQRKNELSKLFQNNKFKHCVEVKPLYIGNDLSEIKGLMEYARSEEWEGLMLNLDKPYVCKRTDSILKIKAMQTCDLRVIGFEEGTSKYDGKLGSLVVNYKGYEVKVGSGFTDADRDYIWYNKDKYLGKIVEIQYFEESKNQEGGISLRFPVFKKLRTDKTEESYD